MHIKIIIVRVCRRLNNAPPTPKFKRDFADVIKDLEIGRLL